MSSSKSLLHSTAFSSVAIYTEYLLGMVVSIIIARHLQPAGFGSYSVVVWMVALGVVFTNSGTATAAIRFVAELRAGDDPTLIRPLIAYLRRAQRIFLLVVLAVGGVALLAAGDRVAPELHHGWLFAFLVATIAIRAMYMFNIGIAKGFQNFRGMAVIAGVSAPITLLMVAVAGWFDAPIEAFLGIFVASSVVLHAMSCWQTAPAIPAAPAGTQLPPELLARVRRHMRLTAMTVTLGFLVGSETEVVFLKAFSGEDPAGQFKVAYQLATGAALLVPGVFGAVLLPMMAGALKQGAEVAAQRFVGSTRYLTLLAAPLIAFGVLFAAPLIDVLYGAAYAPAAQVFVVCLAVAALMTMTQGGSSLLVSADRQGSILVMVATLVVVKIALNLALISRLGLEGAMIAHLVAAMGYVCAVMLLAVRTSGVQPEWGVLARIVLAAGIGAVLAWPLLALGGAGLVAIVAGGAVLGAAYLPLTLALNCWSRSDIDYLRGLHARLGARRSGLVDRLLLRARERAHA
jgi:O-antigen/teichoic acid export membrane protein